MTFYSKADLILAKIKQDGGESKITAFSKTFVPLIQEMAQQGVLEIVGTGNNMTVKINEEYEPPQEE